MIRLSFILVLALFGSSVHESGAAGSSPAPELRDGALPNPEVPEVQTSPECPVASCLIGPVSLTRGAEVPAKSVSEFRGREGQEAELVVVASDPKRTTVKAWLNEEVVLLPSAMPRSGTNQVRVPITLAEQNVLEVRLSAKPGTDVVVWIEGEAAGPPLPPNTEPTVEFRLSSALVGPAAVMNEVCSTEHGGDFEIADWLDLGEDTDPSLIQQAQTAWIQWEGIASRSPSMFGLTYHYLVSAEPIDQNFYAAIEPLFWLHEAWWGQRPVLCKGPGS